MMVGNWTGFFQSVDDPNIRGPASFVVASQDHRRFTGSFSAGDINCSVEGTISASMMLNASGDCGSMGHLVIQGHASEEGPGGIDPCIFDGRWALNGSGGVQKGNLGLLHLQGGPTELATGHWEGRAQEPDGGDMPVTADFRVVPPDSGDRAGTLGVGQVTIGEVPPPTNDKAFTVVYDIAYRPDSEAHGFALVGAGEAGILFFMGNFLPPGPSAPAMIRAHHVLQLTSGDSLEGDVALDMIPPPTND